MIDEIRAVLRDKQLLLIDFDGPICSLYSGIGADNVAAALTPLVQSPELRRRLADTHDPLEVLRLTSTVDGDESAAVEAALVAFEFEAANSAAPTRGAEALITGAKRSGMKVGIVSNNSAGAIRRYLERAQLGQDFDVIVGRPAGKPEEMKPSPVLLLRACAEVGVSADKAAFVGDSVSDVVAARAANIVCIGYANKPSKMDQLGEADLIVNSVCKLATALGKMCAD